MKSGDREELFADSAVIVVTLRRHVLLVLSEKIWYVRPRLSLDFRSTQFAHETVWQI